MLLDFKRMKTQYGQNKGLISSSSQKFSNLLSKLQITNQRLENWEIKWDNSMVM